MPENSAQIIKRYLQDAIAAEKSFETQLRDFAEKADDPEVQEIFEEHADQTKTQYERLTARLKVLGEEPSSTKSFLAQALGTSPKAPQFGHADEERTVQNLIIAYAVESAECAMYESLAVVAEAAADSETQSLAREIQSEETQAADLVWAQIAPGAASAFDALIYGEEEGEEEEERPGRAAA